jgi:hypothetical protein
VTVVILGFACFDFAKQKVIAVGMGFISICLEHYSKKYSKNVLLFGNKYDIVNRLNLI